MCSIAIELPSEVGVPCSVAQRLDLHEMSIDTSEICAVSIGKPGNELEVGAASAEAAPCLLS
ncbi:MAG: hypothetical protein E6J91_39460 [Deltaproteobacteria bacterium]|nr:MAG: hypothetical protein E6J91_39460 [Deltaproteobacteria bacterium]